jgi:ABC-2 type transport system ATP-binding protein
VDHPTAIAARGLTKRFGKVLAIEGIDLDIPAGASLGLLGPSGAGKSTVVGILAGLVRPTAGSATIAGHATTGRAGLEARRRLGVALQQPRFHGWMTGRDVLALAVGLLGLERRAGTERVTATLERVGLADLADVRVAGYPEGPLRRLGLGQALVGEPEVMLLDEPLAGLDPVDRGDLLEVITEARSTATLLVASRQPGDVEALCDRVAVLDQGRLTPDTGAGR